MRPLQSFPSIRACMGVYLKAVVVLRLEALSFLYVFLILLILGPIGLIPFVFLFEPPLHSIGTQIHSVMPSHDAHTLHLSEPGRLQYLSQRVGYAGECRACYTGTAALGSRRPPQQSSRCRGTCSRGKGPALFAMNFFRNLSSSPSCASSVPK